MRRFIKKINVISVVVFAIIALLIISCKKTNNSKILETKILKELRSDLVQNLDEIESNIEYFNSCRQANEIVINHMENSLPYHDSLDYHFAFLYPYSIFRPNKTTFNYLEKNGLFIISNDSLRNKISDVYVYQFIVFNDFVDSYFFEHYSNYIKPMFMAEFETFEYYRSFKPKRYNSFIKNRKYKPILRYSVDASRSFVFMLTSIKEDVEKLILKLDSEVGS